MTCNLPAQFIRGTGRRGVTVLVLALLAGAAVELRAAFVRPFCFTSCLIVYPRGLWVSLCGQSVTEKKSV